VYLPRLPPCPRPLPRPDPGVNVVRTYLEMRAPSALRPASLADPRATLERVAPCPLPLYRALYHDVGARYHWRDRLAWSDEELAAHLASPSVEVWVLHWHGERAGFYELRQHDDGSVEIAYFGLLERAFGRGLGKHLLTRAVERAWSLGATRVWLHTCTLDSPVALPNYLARGFTPYREETYVVELTRDDGG
jgi:GNAT superfamily N-acetyltransferase